MQEVQIRAAAPADRLCLAELLAGFRDELGRSRPGAEEIAAGCARLLEDAAVSISVAAAGPRAVGYALLRRHYSVWAEGEKAVLEDLFVVERARRRGVGRQLLEHAIAAAKQAGCRAMSLDANEGNEPANLLFRRSGFVCARAQRAGGRQVRHDLRLAHEAEPLVRWGEWLVDGGRW